MMKIIFLLIVLASVGNPVNNFAQQTAQVNFDRANELLEDGNYTEAMALYRQIESSGQVSGPLFLNMGIISTQRDSLGLAKFYFLKARRYPETRRRAEEGLNYVNSRFSRQAAVLPKLPWERFFSHLQESPGAGFLFYLGAILLNIGVAAVVYSWFAVQKKHLFKKGGIGVSATAALIVLLSLYVHYLENRYSEAVMITAQTSVKANPDMNADVVSLAYEGYDFTVDHKKSEGHENWLYIRMSNGLYGWIKKSNLRIF